MQDKWTNFYNAHGRFYMTSHPALNKFINFCRKKRFTKILDLGCGSGRNLVKLAEEGFDVSGLDFSPAAASLSEKWLHQKGLEGDIIVGNFDDKINDFAVNSFEGVIAINSLEYGAKGELKNNLSQIHNLLKNKGLFLLVYRSKESQIKHPEVDIRLLKEDELKEIVSKLFRVIEISQDQDKNFVVFAEKT